MDQRSRPIENPPSASSLPATRYDGARPREAGEQEVIQPKSPSFLRKMKESALRPLKERGEIKQQKRVEGHVARFADEEGAHRETEEIKRQELQAQMERDLQDAKKYVGIIEYKNIMEQAGRIFAWHTHVEGNGDRNWMQDFESQMRGRPELMQMVGQEEARRREARNERYGTSDGDNSQPPGY